MSHPTCQQAERLDAFGSGFAFLFLDAPFVKLSLLEDFLMQGDAAQCRTDLVADHLVAANAGTRLEHGNSEMQGVEGQRKGEKRASSILWKYAARHQFLRWKTRIGRIVGSSVTDRHEALELALNGIRIPRHVGMLDTQGE